MDLNSTFESMDGLSVNSPASSQPQSQELFITGSRVRRQQLTLAQMRGVIVIFRHYFPKSPKKRLSKDETNKRWASYKRRIHQEYGRIITGKIQSEKALVKRYSDPLEFLKYKLKRATNLKISELSETNKAYYYEIGGLDDVDELIKRKYNIDSVQKMTNNFQNYNNQRKRRRIQMENGGNNQPDNNHNRNNAVENVEEKKENEVDEVVDAMPPLNLPNINNFSSVSMPPKLETDSKLTEALSYLNDKMDIFEREQLDKKKIEIFEITKQKLIAINQSVETHFINYPHLIGCLPNIPEQHTLAFDCWLNKYKHIILKDPAIKNGLELFIEQLVILKMDQSEWRSFLTKWKMNRIFHKDDFHIIWKNVKSDLNIEEPLPQNDKEENDDDDDDDDDDDIDEEQ